MESFCTRSSISQEFSAPITLQQNGVVKRENRVIQEMARVMLHNKDLVETCGEKSLTLHAIRLTECTLDLVPRRLPMSYGREGSQMSSILEFLEVIISFSRIKRMWENLTPEVMKEYFWDTPLQARLIGYTIKEPRR